MTSITEIKAAARESGIHWRVLNNRIIRGETLEGAIKKPTREYSTKLAGPYTPFLGKTEEETREIMDRYMVGHRAKEEAKNLTDKKIGEKFEVDPGILKGIYEMSSLRKPGRTLHHLDYEDGQLIRELQRARESARRVHFENSRTRLQKEYGVSASAIENRAWFLLGGEK